MTATPADLSPAVEIRQLGHTDYETTWRAMQAFTAQRDVATPDEIWLTEHPPVYTLGIATRSQHLPRGANSIPVVKSDRGGQITYHGPGQIVAYLLLDVRRLRYGVRELVRRMEYAVIDLLATYGVQAFAHTEAPGVYVNNNKVAAVGLRIRHGCCYHGLALNVEMDLQPFAAIDPCGYPGLAVTQLRDLGITDSMQTLNPLLTRHLVARLHRPNS
jgi:lipoyl(octanoyl) transferase